MKKTKTITAYSTLVIPYTAQAKLNILSSFGLFYIKTSLICSAEKPSLKANNKNECRNFREACSNRRTVTVTNMFLKYAQNLELNIIWLFEIIDSRDGKKMWPH